MIPLTHVRHKNLTISKDQLQSPSSREEKRMNQKIKLFSCIKEVGTPQNEDTDYKIMLPKACTILKSN